MQKTTIDDAKKMLNKMNYPVTKQELIKAAKDEKADNDTIKKLNDLQDKEYMTSGDVMKELNMEIDDDKDDK